jgi:DNA-binding beta-propeller fold protein YncE
MQTTALPRTAHSRDHRYGGVLTAVLAAALLALALGTARADAAAPELLLRIPSESFQPGEGAGELNNPRGIAVDPTTGHIYVTDQVNARIDEFTAWGTFVRAWGWGVVNGAAEPQSCGPGSTPPTLNCREGVHGSGAGEFRRSHGVAVDNSGDVYVSESSSEGEANFRVQKFDAEGHFLLMFGGEVDKTTKANVCTAASGHTCGTGVSGAADGQFSDSSVHNYLAFDPKTGTILAGDAGRVQEFNLDGTFKSKFALEGVLAGKSVEALTVDPVTGDLYAVVSGDTHVYRLQSGTGKVLSTVAGEVEKENVPREPLALAVDAAGDVYVDDDPPGSLAQEHPRILEFDSTGHKLIPDRAEEEVCEAARIAERPCERFGEAPERDQAVNGIATNILGPGSKEPGDVYAVYFQSGASSYVNAYGPSPILFESPPKVPPSILAQYAVSVDTVGATLKAQINPHFWPETTYYVQYGTAPCSEGGCVEQPVAPGALLIEHSIDARVTTAGVALGGLIPGTTYHYRFVARSGGSEGKDVFGVGGVPGVAGEETTFTSYRSPTAFGECPLNEAFRIELSAALPDCRAYEMVSPVEKNDGDVLAPGPAVRRINAVDQSSVTGDGLTYSTGTAFGGAQSSFYVSQYLAERYPPGSPREGWSSEAISPAQTRQVGPKIELNNQFLAFSPDLCSAWLQSAYEPVLAEGGVVGSRNLYRREDCGNSGYEALGPLGVPPDLSVYFQMRVQGFSADGNRTVFVANDSLPGSGAPAQPAGCAGENTGHCVQQLYEHTVGQGTSFVCVLPNSGPATHGCSAGMTNESISQNGDYERDGSFQNAVSAGGDRVFWTELSGHAGPGRLFVRFFEEPVSRPVSQIVSGAPARFWGAASDGSRAVFEFEEGGSAVDKDLYSFDVETAEATLIAKGVHGVLGMSQDASLVYFASSEAIAASGQNSHGDEPVPGRENLYVYQEGVGTSFIATLNHDARFNPVEPEPFFRDARVSPDGLRVAFVSSAPLTGYDNTDAVNGQADDEVFVYDAQTGKLACVSCNPSGARPTGIDLQTVWSAVIGSQWAAGFIPGWPRPQYASRALSADGKRLFFESYDALVPRDTNGAGDVYEWEATGTGSCTEADAAFSAVSEGCVYLISSGQSPRESSFIDADPSGENVFFSTLSSLVPQDPGLVDIYDARVNGGFPVPVPAAGCEGEACQSPPAPPLDTTPGSLTFSGTGNLASEPQAQLKPKALTRAQKLARALRLCRSKPKRKQARCKAQARRTYAVKARKAAGNPRAGA